MADQPCTSSCKVCNKSQDANTPLSRCGKCKTSFYCSRECQVTDWPSHKNHCRKEWYDNEKMRQCRDGSYHEGKLELVTWRTPPNPEDGPLGEELGFASMPVEEGETWRKKFEDEFHGDEKKLFKEWERAFRWTCCGMAGDSESSWGCDHHGTGSKPCTCDFCQMGKPVTEKIYTERCRSAHGRGLQLPRGPDSRSYKRTTAGINAMARGFLGMDD